VFLVENFFKISQKIAKRNYLVCNYLVVGTSVGKGAVTKPVRGRRGAGRKFFIW